MTPIVSHRPSLRMIPSAPSAQLTGAMFAPAQIHICCGPVEPRAASGMGSMLRMSARNSEFVMLAPVHKTIIPEYNEAKAVPEGREKKTIERSQPAGY